SWLPSSAAARASERRPPSAAARLFQARHDINEIAGPMAAVELPLEDAVPRILAGSWRPRQTEYVGAVGRAAAGARLDGWCCGGSGRQDVGGDRDNLDI